MSFGVKGRGKNSCPRRGWGKGVGVDVCDYYGIMNALGKCPEEGATEGVFVEYVCIQLDHQGDDVEAGYLGVRG